MADIKIKTPGDFVEEESKNLRKHLDNYDIQINKLGFAGFFINLLGNIRYDSFQYYQNLFKESFVALAEDENNLYMHSSIYGYTTSFATPAVAEGSITFDFSYLPKDKTHINRIVTLKNIVFLYGDIPFTTNTVYKFVEDGNDYYGIVYMTDGTVNYIPSSTSKITIPFFDVEQYFSVKESFKIPNYQYGSYYPYKFSIDNFLSDLKVYVKVPTGEYPPSSEGDLFDIKKIKYLENRHSQSCFLKEFSSDTFILEFGSGLRGAYVPGSTVTLYKNITNGVNGRITASKELKIDSTSSARLFVINNDNDVASEQEVSYRFFTINFDYSDHGHNPPTGDDLRTDIFEFIQSREFLIDQKDYYNLTELNKGDYVYSFRKSHIFRNDFYLHQTLRDEYQNPIKSTCLNLCKIDTSKSITGLLITQIKETDGDLLGTLEYIIFATDRFHISQQVSLIGEVNSPNNAVELIWDEFADARNYVIVVYDGRDYRYFTTTNTYFIDVGQDSDYTNSFIYSYNDSDEPFFSWDDSYIFFPEVIYNSVEFLSPFVYKYNKNFNWFEGYLFYDDFIVLISNVNNNLNKNSNHITPYFHLRLKYDYDNMMTIIEAISSQAIEDYVMRFTISETDIHRKLGTIVEENVFSIEYTDGYYGILDGEKTVEIELFYNVNIDSYDSQPILAHFVSNNFFQIRCIKDQLKLLHYIDETSKEHVLSIPLINKTYYENNREDTDLTIMNSVQESNIKGRRFPGDEVQFRFLNTYMIDAKYLRNSVIQEHDFDLYLPLKLFVTVLYDTHYIENNNIDLIEEKEKLYFEIAQTLQDNYSGNQIKCYNSQLVDIIHTNRSFIKSVSVIIKDFNDRIIENGIESIVEEKIMENIQNEASDKMSILDYFPHYWYWDLDNIQIDYLF